MRVIVIALSVSLVSCSQFVGRYINRLLRQNAPAEQDKAAENVNGFIIREEYSHKNNATNADDTLKQLFDFEMVEGAVPPRGSGGNGSNDNYQAMEPALSLDDFVSVQPYNTPVMPEGYLVVGVDEEIDDKLNAYSNSGRRCEREREKLNDRSQFKV
jgi:hypothetical protein